MFNSRFPTAWRGCSGKVDPRSGRCCAATQLRCAAIHRVTVSFATLVIGISILSYFLALRHPIVSRAAVKRQRRQRKVNAAPRNCHPLLFACSAATRLDGSGARDEVWNGSVWVGQGRTNNEAEYSGLIEGLRAAKELGIKVGFAPRTGSSRRAWHCCKGCFLVEGVLYLPYSEHVLARSFTRFFLLGVGTGIYLRVVC